MDSDLSDSTDDGGWGYDKRYDRRGQLICNYFEHNEDFFLNIRRINYAIECKNLELNYCQFCGFFINKYRDKTNRAYTCVNFKKECKTIICDECDIDDVYLEDYFKCSCFEKINTNKFVCTFCVKNPDIEYKICWVCKEDMSCICEKARDIHLSCEPKLKEELIKYLNDDIIGVVIGYIR